MESSRVDMPPSVLYEIAHEIGQMNENVTHLEETARDTRERLRTIESTLTDVRSDVSALAGLPDRVGELERVWRVIALLIRTWRWFRAHKALFMFLIPAAGTIAGYVAGST